MSSVRFESAILASERPRGSELTQLLPLHAFMGWTTTVPLLFTFQPHSTFG